MGCKFLNHHLMLILLIQLFLWVTLFVNGQFIPGPRSGHTATHIGEKIYFIGGANFSNTNQETQESDIFYYDGNKLAWVEVNSQVNGQGADLPPKFGHTANIGVGSKQDLIFIIGGDRYSRDNIIFMSSASYEGKIYLFGGVSIDNKIVYMSDIPRYSTVSNTWSSDVVTLAQGNTPGPRAGHSAVLGNDTNNKVNGYKGLNFDFYIFDFNNFEWYITTTDELTNPSANIQKLFSSSSVGAIIGSSVLGVLVIVGILIFVYYRRKKNQSKGDVGYPADDSNISYDKVSFSQRSTLYSSQPSMQCQFTYQQFTPEQCISNIDNLT
ncbi:16832_t:CDS:2 [Rhizophagus irregularis]|nr:16832_t:CDS:2 [Rhizophagus irregularis]